MTLMSLGKAETCSVFDRHGQPQFGAALRIFAIIVIDLYVLNIICIGEAYHSIHITTGIDILHSISPSTRACSMSWYKYN
jgi:hypothetical protein